MALAKKCDRCGNFYQHYPMPGNKPQCNTIGKFQRNAAGETINGCCSSKCDLCQECMAEFEKFMASGGKCNDQI